jgi:hypothetical protein
VYKYNSDTNFRLNNVYINVGNNNWLKSTNQSTLNFNHNTSILSYVFDYEFKQLYKAALCEKKKTFNKFYNFKQYSTLNEYRLFKNKTGGSEFIKYINDYNLIKFNVSPDRDNVGMLQLSYNKYNTFNLNKLFIKEIDKNSRNLFFLNNNYNLFSVDNYIYKNFFETDKLDIVEETLDSLRLKNSKFPIKLIRGLLNKHNLSLLSKQQSLNSNILFNYKLNNTDVTEKISQVEQFWGFRQKKYKKLRFFSFSRISKFNNKTYTHINNFVDDKFDKYQAYTAIKNNKHKNESIPVTLAKRLLRTKRTLMLPAHINITLITGSYDVVHS